VINWFQAFAFEWVNLYRYSLDFLFAAYITQDTRDRDTLNAKFKAGLCTAVESS
jgi:hypothetical protein